MKNFIYKTLTLMIALHFSVNSLAKENSTDFNTFFNVLKKSIQNKKPSETADLFTFPMSIQVNLVKTEYKTKDDFIKEYPNIFTEAVEAAITKKSFRKLKGYWAIGNGKIWFERKKNKFYIYRIFK